MKLNRNEHNRFIQWLDRTAEKNPLLWLPCVLLIALTLAGEHIAEYLRIVYTHRNTEKIVREKPQFVRKPFALRVVAMSLVVAFGFMFTADVGQAVYADEYYYNDTSNTDWQNDINVTGSDPFGNMLADEFNAKSEEQEANAGYNVFSVEMQENTAVVDYEAIQNSTLVVGIYDESENQLITTSSIEVTAEASLARLDMDSTKIPQYFYIKAYLINTETMRPLCTVYECPTYTQEMQELLNQMDLDADVVESGQCGEDVYWSLSNDGILTISGVGKIETVYGSRNSHMSNYHAPWYDLNNRINEVIISEGITEIGESAFYMCSALSIQIPSSLKIIGDHAFCNCSRLTDVILPQNVTSLGDYSFNMCVNIKEITIPDGVTEINRGAFSECRTLEKIVIPQSVLYISDYETFENCLNLTIYCVPDSYAEQYAKDNGIPYKNINEFPEPNPPSYENIISSENGKLIYEAMSVDGYRPVTQYSIDTITIKFGGGVIYDESNLFFTTHDNMIEINKYIYTDSCVTFYYTVWGIGETDITITANDGETLTIPISIFDSNLKLRIEAETKDADNLKVSGKNEIKNDPFQVGFSITPQLERSVPGVDLNDRELYAEINALYEKMKSKVKSMLKIEKIAIKLSNGFIFEDGSVENNVIPIIPFILEERTTYFVDKKVLTKVAPITDTGEWKKGYIFNVYIKMNGNEYNCDGNIYVENADYVSPPPEDNPTIDDEHRDYYLQNNEYSKKLYNSIRAMIDEGDFVKTYSDSTLSKCVTDSDTYHDMITMLGIWKTAATSEFAISSNWGSYRNSVNNYCLEFYNVSVKDPEKMTKPAKNATVRFQLVDDLASYYSCFQYIQQYSTDIKFDATFNHINYQIEWSDKSYGNNGIYSNIYQVSAGADINSYYEGVKQYLSTKYDNEIQNLLKNCFYGIVGNPSSPLNFMSEVVEFCKLYEQANKHIGHMKKLIQTSVSFGMVCGSFKEYKVFCPVDVYVYDYDTDILLGSIVNNKVNENNRIKMYIYGETKCFELPTIKKYKVRLVGNDIGNMTYSINEYDSGQVYKLTTNFYDLHLQDGKEYTYVLEKNNDEYLIENNGNVIYPDESNIDGNVHTHTYSTSWKYNSTSHWHECTVCGEHADTARHDERNAVVTVQPTSTTAGTMTYYCSICGYAVRTETISPIEPTLPYPVNPLPSDPTITYPTNTEKEPYIYGDTSKSGWDTIISEIDFAADGSTVRVNMNGTYELPKDVVSRIQNRNINLELHCGGAIWTINGFDVTNPKTVNLRVSDRYNKIPASVIDCLNSELTVKELRLYHNGDFGFKATLTVSVGKKYNNYYGALYHYNTKTKQLEFVDESLAANRQITFELTHASYYAIAFNSVPLYDDISSGAGVTADSIPIDFAIPTSDGVAIPAIKLPQIMKYSSKKRRYRILKKRRLDDLVFVL